MFRPQSLSVFLAAALTVGLVSQSSGVLRSSGPPNDVCAAPPSFQSCTQCHVGTAVNAGPGSITVFTPPTYTPGQTYTLLVEVQDPTAARWGFELTALDRNDNGAGTFAPRDTQTQVSSSVNADYVKHTGLGTGIGQSGGYSWSFDWTAPASNIGPIRFYAAGNGANANSNSTGDHIYSTAIAVAAGPAQDASVTLQPESTLVSAGSTWNVKAVVRDHTGSANNVLLVSRVQLGPGNFFPKNGWLFGPDPIALSGNNWVERTMTHVIPANVPPLTATYQGIVGRAPNIVVNLDSFVFQIQ